MHLIFQPAEEGGAGAKAMMEDGLFQRFACQAVFALHNWPDLPQGQMAVRVGPIMAANIRFEIRVRGKGGHAALPHTTALPGSRGLCHRHAVANPGVAHPRPGR